MALYAFDGTWNENTPADANDTNVVRFHEAYTGEKWYVEGPGTRLGWLGRLAGGVFGSGGKARVKEAYAALERNFAKDAVIDIIGFSRGAALALDFANMITERGVNGTQTPPIRFVGLWDVVPSFGIPGNDINLGYTLSLPDTVQKCFHAMALDERRRKFRVQRVVTTMADAEAPGRVFEVWFRGVHGDIGGGNGNTGLSSITLHWMYSNAAASGLSFPAAAVTKAADARDPEAPISKNFDPIENKPRPIPWTDSVHESVAFRPGAVNPPAGMLVVDDSGGHVRKFPAA